MADRILFLDDSEERCRSARVHLQATCVHTATEAINALSLHRWDVVYLDHDLGGMDDSDTPRTAGPDGKTGADVVRWIIDQVECVATDLLPTRFVVHSLNEPAARLMVECLRDDMRPAERIPFTRLIQQWRDAAALEFQIEQPTASASRDGTATTEAGDES